jgi:hypothetical protein
MNGVSAVYKGRVISKEHFRVFIYAPDGSQKLVDSWDAFEKHMESGLWFDCKEKAQECCVTQEEPQKLKKARGKSVKDEEKEDDFLPKEG